MPKLEKFREVPPAEIPDELSQLAVVGLVVINTTIINTADDKILLLGREGRKGLRLPSLDTKVHSIEYVRNPFTMSRRLLEFLFEDPSGLDDPGDYDYLGLLKIKPPKRRFVLPMIVDLDYASDDPRLKPSEGWLSHKHEHPDFFWTPLHKLPQLIAKAGVYDDSVKHSISANTAEMIGYYFEQDTYLE